MGTAAAYPHIVIDDLGTARLDGTRYKVAHLAAEHYQHGWTAEELLRQHPDLRPEQVYAALAFFYDHFQAIVTSLQESLASSEASRAARPLSRAELLSRASTGGR
jgi:uncharacterized protein (DUF433 family)